jgi:hypothetical protein
MDDPALVTILQRKHDLRHVLTRVVLAQSPQLLQQGVQISTNGVLHDNIQMSGGGEGVEELDDERVVGVDQCVALRHRLANHVLVYQVTLADSLDGIKIASGVLAAQKHLSEFRV